MKAKFAVVCLIGIAAVVGAFPASTAQAADTTVTATVEAGGLSISVPVTVDLGAGSPGTTVSGSVGSVTVTDARAALEASWTASVSATAFTTGGGTPAETISNADVLYWSGPATATTGSGTFTPGQPTSGDAESLDSSRTTFSLTGGVGNDSATWNPTLSMNVPASAVAGTYTGTVTETVV